LGDVNGRDSERREDVPRHALDGDPGAKADGDDEYDNGERSAERCLNQVHRLQDDIICSGRYQ